MEPVYHNLIFIFISLMALAGLADLLKPERRLRRQESKRLRKEKRKSKHSTVETDSATSGSNAIASRVSFSAKQRRKVRIGGGVCLLIASIGLVCLQPTVGWTVHDNTPPQSDVPTLEQLVRQRVEAFVGQNHIVGMTVAAIADGEETLIGIGRRDLRSKTPPDGETIYEIGSISKTFTGILLAHEIENGRANLDDPVSAHLPDGVMLPESREIPIQLRHLTTHSSGFPRRADNFTDMGSLIDFVFGWDPYWDYTDDEFWQAVMEVEFGSKPGDKVQYSNFGTALLGTLMARHEHASFESMVRKTICDPLKMNDTIVQLNEDQRDRMALGYRSIANIGPLTFALGSQAWKVPDCLAGASGMHSTCNDMLKYLKANMGLTDFPASRAMGRSHEKLRDWFDDYSIGMNWIRQNRKDHVIIWHNGRTSGFRCFIGFTDNRRFGVAILTNSQADVDSLGKSLLDSMAQALGDTQRPLGNHTDSAEANHPATAVATDESRKRKN